MSSAFGWHVNQSFDPFAQNFTVLGPDGTTPVIVSLPFLRQLQLVTLVGGIGEGTQIGAAAILLVCLLLVTKTDKRRSLVFLLNALALLLVVLRGIFSCLTYTGAFYNWYRWETYYYDAIGNAMSISICTEVFDFLLICVIELSLVLQVRIVCCTLDPHWRQAVNIFNIIAALLLLGVRLALMILSIDWNIVGVQHEREWQFHRLGRLAASSNILMVVSIAISAAIFCAKLGFAIRSRRSMGMTQFGPMQIIFVMGCQTLFTPLIFVMVAFFGFKQSNIQSFVPTAIALSLPLSAMWAAANTTNVHIAAPDPQLRHVIPVGRTDLASAKAYGGVNLINTTATTISDTLIDDDSIMRTSPTKNTEFVRSSKSDVEMQKMAEGVHVDRSYSVRSD